MARKSEGLKLAFEDYCGRHGLIGKREYRPGRATLMAIKGLYLLETTHVSTCTHVPGRVGFAYPAGVKGLTDKVMAAWLRAH